MKIKIKKPIIDRILSNYLLQMVVFFSITSSWGAASVVEIIKKPIPNLMEKQYVQLQKIRTLNPDLGSGEYLFNPFSITTDGKNIFVYDNLQAKIFQLDKKLNYIRSYGRKGRGPGEFSGTGKAYPVIIKFYADQYLYAYDVFARKLMVLDKHLKYLKEYVNLFGSSGTPIVDRSGRKYFFTVDKNKAIHFIDEQKNKRWTEKGFSSYFNFLYNKPRLKLQAHEISFLLANQITMEITPNSDLLLYFKCSSAMVVLNNGKVKLKKYLWPRDALNSYKNDLEQVMKTNQRMHRYMFFKLFFDKDTTDIFYLHYGLSREKNINAIYKFNLRGELLEVLVVKPENREIFSRFELKVGNCFYAVEDTDLSIYQKINQ